MPIKTFLIVRTNNAHVSLRRYATVDGGCVPGHSYHNESTIIGTCDVWKEERKDGFRDWVYAHNAPESVDHADPRWPTKCEYCDYLFQDNDPWQITTDDIYRRTDNDTALSLRDAPEGAMYDAEWLPEAFGVGEDGRRLHVVCPGGFTWHIDGRASNCTLPDDKVHKCWVRHGVVPNITVDKDGVTCSAGGGSIIAGKYHGFLRNGEFTENM